MLLGKNLIKALLAAGIVDDQTTRVIIDVRADELVKIYSEKLGDARMFDIIGALSNAELEVVEHGNPSDPNL